MKNFLDYLYYKYYYWQIKVGNKDIASITAMLFIAFITLLLVQSIIILVVITINPKDSIEDLIFSVGSALITWGIILIGYSFFFFHKRRYKILIDKKTLKKKSNFWAIALPVFAVILPNLIFIVLMLRNQGKL